VREGKEGERKSGWEEEGGMREGERKSGWEEEGGMRGRDQREEKEKEKGKREEKSSDCINCETITASISGKNCDVDNYV